MDYVYAGRRKNERGRGMRLYERYGNIREEEAFADSGISGLRSLGLDYSGISGAPCLFALVDRIKGGGRKIWTWQLPKPDKGNKESKEGSKTAHTEGNMFTVAKAGGATLRGVFVTGQRPEAEVRMTSMKGRAGSSRGKTLKRPVRGVFAEDEEGEFFVVVTVQQGEPPSIKVEGKGLQAKVTVGNRIIRFDDKHIIFEMAL